MVACLLEPGLQDEIPRALTVLLNDILQIELVVCGVVEIVHDAWQLDVVHFAAEVVEFESRDRRQVGADGKQPVPFLIAGRHAIGLRPADPVVVAGAKSVADAGAQLLPPPKMFSRLYSVWPLLPYKNEVSVWASGPSG